MSEKYPSLNYNKAEFNNPIFTTKLEIQLQQCALLFQDWLDQSES